MNYKSTPRAYQSEAIKKNKEILNKYGYSALFMEMGLGKSLCSLYSIDEDIKKTIIFCPKALQLSWAEQIAEHIETPPPVFIWRSNKVKNKSYQKEISTLFNSNKIIVIINLEALQTKNDALEKMIKNLLSFAHCIICDESSFIKTHNSNRTKRLINLTKNATNKMILTGTEITNGILDLYSQFRFLKHDFWDMKNYYAFRARYAVLNEIYLNNGRIVRVVVGYQRTNELVKKIDHCTIRLKKNDCLDLPEKIFENIYIEMDKEQKRVYKDLKDRLYTEYKGQIITVNNAISLFIRFRQITGGFMPDSGELISPIKYRVIIEDCKDYPQKTIIWCAHTAEIEYMLNEIGEKSVSFYGGTENREKSVDRFKNDDNCLFFLSNPKAGGYGLNLQFSSLAYYYSKPLSPEQYWQSQDRQHRFGTKNNVVYKSIICKNSIDERIETILSKKTNFKDSFKNIKIDDLLDQV